MMSPCLPSPIKPYTSRVNYSPIVTAAALKSCYHLISSFKIGPLCRSEGAKAAPSIWCHKSNRTSHPTSRFAFCPCYNICCDSSFILLVRKKVIFIRALKSYLRSVASHIVRVSLIDTTSVSRLSLPLLIWHIAWSSAPAPIILEISSSHLS